MAVYGRHREKWDPTKIKSKTSKNNTLELTGADNKRLLFWMSPESLTSTSVLGTKALLSSGLGELDLSIHTDIESPSLSIIEGARFKPNAISFPKASATGRCYVESAADATALSADMIAGRDDDRTWDTYISFWVKVPSLNFGTSTGHNIGGFYRNSTPPQTDSNSDNPGMDASLTTIDALRPAILFNISTSGTVSIRFRQDSDDQPDPYYRYYESNANGKLLTANQWNHVTYVIKRIDDENSSGSNDYLTMVDIYIDGVNTGTPTYNTNHQDQDFFNADLLEFIIGNQEFGYDAGDTTERATQNVDGFTGAIGEFIIFTQPATEHASVTAGVENTDGANRRNMAKFIYEAQKEGVFALHSGVHSSSPRLEQLDLDNDTSYPPNFSLQAFTGFEKGSYYDADRDMSVSLRSTSRFTEGYNSGEAFEEKAGKYFVNSTRNRDLESITMMPHLRLNPSDTILTNGNWYSDARSEFFAEDLDPKSGFIVSNLNDGIAGTLSSTTTVTVASTAGFVAGQKLTKISGDGNFHADGVTIASVDSATQITTSANHAGTGAILFNVGAQGITQQLTGYIPTPADEIYKEHAHTTTVAKFHDMTLGEEYKDTFVIEIPLPNVADLTLSTDQGGTSSSEIAEYKTKNPSSDGFDNQNSNQACNTMAYYNFSTGKWEHTTPAWSSRTSSALGFNWQATADIGFSSMSGLVLPTDGENLEYIMDSYGRPMTTLGFPFHKKFESAAGQSIDLSKYLDESVILEGWEISTPVIPKVGYQHNLAGSAEVTTADGPTGFYTVSDGKSPFYYGAHGHACVFWDERENALPFEERTHTVSSDHWMVSGTVPVGGFDTAGKESSPTGTAKGLVTKGVTAFLLKESVSTIEDVSNIYKKYVSVDKVLTVTANNIDAYSGEEGFTPDYSATKQNLLPGGLTANTSTIRENNLTSNPTSNTVYPFFGQDFYDIKAGSRFEDEAGNKIGAARELIGYLQHVYHNDGVYDSTSGKWIDNFNNPRHFWQRNFGTTESPNYVGATPSEAYLGVSLQNIINRENNTLVPNLLRENTDQYQLHVSGSMKGLTPYDAGYPINFFKMASDNTGAVDTFQFVTDNSGGVNMAHGDVPYMQSYGFFPSSEGSTISEFVQRDMTPMIYGKGKSKTIPLPETSFPNSGVSAVAGSTLADYRSVFIKSDIQMSLNPTPETDVVLRPSDKLILGIQDSVSTVPLSQQTLGSNTSSHFVRWGRNSLVLPANKSGYLRLFVRKTRNDKSYNVVSDESNYNHNVNRDLGDHNIGDKHRINNPSMYAGSTADDIMGPTFFTPPLMEIDVQVDTGIANTLAVGDFNDSAASWNNGINLIAQTGHYAKFSTDASSGIENFNLKWYNASHRLFKNRGQSTTTDFPLLPAIDWLDGDLEGFADYAEDSTVARDGQTAQSNEKQWFNCSQMFQWVLADPGAGSGGSYDGQLAGSRATPGIDPHGQATSPTGVFRFRNFVHPKELNTNSAMSGTPTPHHAKIVYPGSATVSSPSPLVSDRGTDLSAGFLGYDSPGMSAWGLTTMLPIFSDPSDGFPLVPIPSAVKVEFKLVKILYHNYDYTQDRDAAGQYAKRPTYTDGTEMKVGDAFYFYSHPTQFELNSAGEALDGGGDPARIPVTPRQDIVKLDLSTSFDIYNPNQADDQRVMRNWRGQRDAYGGPIIFIVAGQVNIESASPGSLVDPTNHSTGNSADGYQLTYSNVYSIISRILGLHSAWDSSILANVENYWDGTTVTAKDSYCSIPEDHSGNFKIFIPKDPFIRRTFSQFETQINSLMEFKLCGITIDANTIVTTADNGGTDSKLDNKVYLYKSGGGHQTVSQMDFNTSTYDGGGDPPRPNIPTFGGLLQTAGTIGTGGVTHTVKKTDFAGDYFLPMTANAKNGDDSTSAGADVVPTGNDTSPASGAKLTRTMYQIDYSNLVRTFPILKITNETYNESINRRIDRFVQRRTTELTNTTDTTKPLVAGPFGSLKNYMQLSSRHTIYDSLPAISLHRNLRGYCNTFAHGNKADCDADNATNWILTDYITTMADVPQNWPFADNEFRSFRIFGVNHIKVKMLTNAQGSTGGRYNTHSNNASGKHAVVTDETLDPVIGVYDWSGSYETGSTSGSTKDTTEGTLGFLNVTNYIQNDFKGNVDFTRKTLTDYLVGFGDGPQGRNVVRPLLYGSQAWTSGDPKTFAQEYIIDKPRGARFGQYNTSRMRGNYIYMYNHYGHFRDMLEQPIDTRFTRGIFNESIFGSPVVVSGVNTVNPEAPKLLANTSRYNKTRNATVTKPYIEHGYEDISQPTNLQNDTLRVDVPGSLRTGQTLIPGNIAASIRNR